MDLHRIIKTKTVLEVFKACETELTSSRKMSEAKMVQTALLRFTAPGWGGPVPRGSRATREDIEAALSFLEQIPAHKLKDALSVQQQVFSDLKLAPKKQNNWRYYLRVLIQFAETHGWLEEQNTKNTPDLIRFNQPPGQGIGRPCRLTNLTRRQKYQLGLVEGDILNPTISRQIEEFEKWLKPRIKEETVDINLRYCKYFLAWLTRSEGVSFDDLRLELMIPFDPLPRRSDYPNLKRDEFLALKEDQIDIAKERAEDAVQRFGRYLNFYSENPRTRHNPIAMAINVAKFLYRQQIDEDDPTTIPPILSKLRRLSRENGAKKKETPSLVPWEKKFIEFEEVLEVVKKLKKEADQDVRIAHTGKKQQIYWEKRTPYALSKSLRRFLIIAFLSCFPPDRQQLIRLLEIGTSFRRGQLASGNIFIPVEEMKNPSTAQWCILIDRSQYKTGKKYGNFKITVPDYDFGDGTTLYQYINRWINDYRPLYSSQESWLFMQFESGKQLNRQDVYHVVRKAFYKHTGRPVHPHLLRHIFNTFLAESHASEEVKRASRKMMKQSDKIADTVYTHAVSDRVVAPAINYMQELILDSFQHDTN